MTIIDFGDTSVDVLWGPVIFVFKAHFVEGETMANAPVGGLTYSRECPNAWTKSGRFHSRCEEGFGLNFKLETQKGSRTEQRLREATYLSDDSGSDLLPQHSAVLSARMLSVLHVRICKMLGLGCLGQ